MSITDLYKMYCSSGIDGKQIITTEELIDLKNRLKEIADFMRYRNDNSVVVSLWSTIEGIERIIAKLPVEREANDEMTSTHH